MSERNLRIVLGELRRAVAIINEAIDDLEYEADPAAAVARVQEHAEAVRRAVQADADSASLEELEAADRIMRRLEADADQGGAR